METTALQLPELIHVADETGNIHLGCDQEWYNTAWQRMAGCGPCVASNVLLYLHRQKRITLPFDVQNREDFKCLMEQVWKYVTPTQRGIYQASLWIDGVSRFMQAHGISLECRRMNIPQRKKYRPELTDAIRFIEEGLQSGCPVAFLNLSNGRVHNLDAWHWVTVVALCKDENSIRLQIYDAAKTFDIDFGLWFETTRLGGGLVFLT